MSQPLRHPRESGDPQQWMPAFFAGMTIEEVRDSV
jgi:hypothetical protein